MTEPSRVFSPLRRGMFAAVAVALVGVAAPARAVLVINATYAANINADPNAATIKGTIQAAINEYQNTFSDNINVSIMFQEMSTGLGQGNTTIYNIPITASSSTLAADATTADDATALANVPGGRTTP